LDHPIGILRRLQALSTVADVATTVALAGSLFFSISPTEAKSKVALYLALTVAPFAIVAPLLAPAIDRGANFRRGAIVVSGVGRIVAALLMSFNVHSVLLFPEALLSLVASKLYLITKAALVPDLLGYQRAPSDDPNGEGERSATSVLVKANANLSLLGAIVGLIGGAIAGGVLKIPFLGAPWVLRLEIIPLVLLVLQVPHLRHRTTLGEPRKGPVEYRVPEQATGVRTESTRQRRSSAGGYSQTLVASSAMAVLRAGVGFFTFLVAFELKRQGSHTYVYALALGASAAGSALATLITPRIRRVMRESTILVLALLVEAAGALAAAEQGSIAAEIALAFLVGLVASGGKLAFDAIVQHHVAAHRHGKTFARYEMRFQLGWVLGALIPTIVSLPLKTGDVVIAASAIVATFSFAAGRTALMRRDDDNEDDFAG
jgi:hypothetical protein